MMPDDRAPSLVLVELDALLDTRLGTLHSMNPEFAVEALRSSAYFTRVIDDFTEICGVGKDEFREAYSRRGMEQLVASTITEIPFILAELTMKLEAEIIDTPFVSDVIVEINCYPYELDEEEQSIIANAVSCRLNKDTLVRCVYKAPETLSPSYVKGRYGGMILYNFRDWMDKHVEAFKNVKMPRITILAPALYYDEIPSKHEFTKDGIRPEVNAFQLSEVGLVEFFSLSLLPAQIFSILQAPIRKINEQKQ